MIDRVLLDRIRAIIIQLLNALDDTLGYERTIPTQHMRRLRKGVTLTMRE